MRKVLALLVISVAMAGPLPAWGYRLGGSLGMAFPTGRLADSTDAIGDRFLPAPGLGVLAAFDPAEGMPRLSGEWSIEANVFRSEDDKDLNVVYVPILASALWKAGSLGGLDMQLRAGAGGGFFSANKGDDRSSSGAALSFGWRIGRELRDVTCAVETGVDLVFNGGTRNLLKLKLLVFTR